MNLAYIIGALLMLHAAYLAHEHHTISTNGEEFPSDILLEVVIGLVMLVFGAIDAVSAKPRLSLENKILVEPSAAFLRPIKMSDATADINALETTEYERLETRVDFIDIKAKRREHLDWLEARK